MRQIIVIPARYASTRLPGKPLLDIAGKPMLQRVYEQACTAELEMTLIATDDERIYKAMSELGFEVCMTSQRHQSGTDRIAEVAEQLSLNDEDILINVQGDEPLIPSPVILQVGQLLLDHPQASISTLSTRIKDIETLQNPNVVKVISDANEKAIYFSRAPIPWHRASNNHSDQSGLEDYAYQRHIGIYAYRAGFLKEFTQWSVCPLELTESLEQLRAIWHGHEIVVAPACLDVPEGIDTQADLDAIRQQYNNS